MKAQAKKAAVADPLPTLAEQAKKLKDLVEQADSALMALREIQDSFVEAIDDVVKAKTGKNLWWKDGLVGGDADAYRRLNGLSMANSLLKDSLEARIEEAFDKAADLHERLKGATAPARAPKPRERSTPKRRAA